MCAATNDLTALLRNANNGDNEAMNELFNHVYATLRRIAQSYMRRERCGNVLQATALVNEAYLRMFRGMRLEGAHRAQFFQAAAHVMRQVLIDYARAANAGKRQGQRVTLQEWMSVLESSIDSRLDLEAAMQRLKLLDERQERIMVLHIYAGRSASEIAEQLGVTPRTIHREIASATLFLKKELLDGSNDDSR